MKYKYCRRIRLKRFIPQLEFESAEYCVEQAESKEQAIKEVESWIAEDIEKKKAELEKMKELKKLNTVPFKDNLLAK